MAFESINVIEGIEGQAFGGEQGDVLGEGAAY